MNNGFLNELLIDPLTGERLIFDITSGILKSSVSGNRYFLIESIPRIIIEDNQFIQKSGLHQEYQSEFKYSDHYQKDADIFDYTELGIPDITKNEFNRLRESVLREISDDYSVVLDVGCGNGWVSKELIPLGKKVISMDISTTNPINAIKRVQHKNHAGLIADIYNIPLRENSIDCIIASEVLEHIQDPKSCITSLINLLKPNGKLILTTPYNEKIEYYLCVHCNKPTPKHAHLHSFNEDNIIQFIPHTGITWSNNLLINRYLSLIRSYIILKYLPYTFWKAIDSIFNKLFGKPTRLQIVILKLL